MSVATLMNETELHSFVLLRLGERRFALAANQISELVAPSRVFRLPHRTPKIEGVIFRRGRIIPVCDVGQKLLGKEISTRRFYLIAVRRYEAKSELVAVPVTGDCELIKSEMMPPSESDADHIGGWLSYSGDVIEVLNLDALTPRSSKVGTLNLPGNANEVQS
jgi:chemotaxis signal transduction protein